MIKVAEPFAYRPGDPVIKLSDERVVVYVGPAMRGWKQSPLANRQPTLHDYKLWLLRQVDQPGPALDMLVLASRINRVGEVIIVDYGATKRSDAVDGCQSPADVVVELLNFYSESET